MYVCLSYSCAQVLLMINSNNCISVHMYIPYSQKCWWTLNLIGGMAPNYIFSTDLNLELWHGIAICTCTYTQKIFNLVVQMHIAKLPNLIPCQITFSSYRVDSHPKYHNSHKKGMAITSCPKLRNVVRPIRLFDLHNIQSRKWLFHKTVAQTFLRTGNLVHVQMMCACDRPQRESDMGTRLVLATYLFY